MSKVLTYQQLGRNGRFGNQLFQIASTIGIANTMGIDWGFSKWEYQRFFENTLSGIEGYEEVISLKGYLQDYSNFQDCEKLIRQLFTMKEQPIKKLENTIFIHFRAYSVEGVTDLHPEQTIEYYQQAISLFANKNFIIFTDNIEKARKTIGNSFEIRSGLEMEDFYLMQSCDGGIISNSSYSWWAGYLCGGPVVLPMNWFTAKATYPRNGYYKKDWIAL